MIKHKGKIIENKLRKKIRTLVEDVLKEDGKNSLDSNDLKVALRLINGMSEGSVGLDHATNDRGLKNFNERLIGLRIEIMEYCEKNSGYTFYGKSPYGFKLVKKGK